MPKPADIPACPEAPSVQSPARVVREYDISLVTPLFGGGAEAGIPDESLPIRGTSIRGQLQFWWRATRGAAFATSEALFDRHAEIWGTTEKASPIEILLRNVKTSAAKPCGEYQWNPGARGGQGGWRPNWAALFAHSQLPYALFPFQGKEPASPAGEPQTAPSKFIETASFALQLRYPAALEDDVRTAVWAWVNFGGLGARTRRGCGSLLCKELAPQGVDDLKRWFRTGLGDREEHRRRWPTMPTSFLVGRPESPLDAWKRAIAMLQAFRQGDGIARNPGTRNNRPGRSRYPEPETIRRITGRHSPSHQRLTHIPDDAFPRAELGLPIIFHFQGQGEPADSELYPSPGSDGQERQRMASPIILKPLALAGEKAVTLIMRLDNPPLDGVVLKSGERSLELPRTTTVRGPRLAAYFNSPLAASPSGSAIEAFLHYATLKGFTEVVR